jgi:hypothetical protein
MSGPDGLEQRTAEAQEQSWLDDERLTLDEQLADESRDDPENWS